MKSKNDGRNEQKHASETINININIVHIILTIRTTIRNNYELTAEVIYYQVAIFYRIKEIFYRVREIGDITVKKRTKYYKKTMKKKLEEFMNTFTYNWDWANKKFRTYFYAMFVFNHKLNFY